MNKNFLIIIFTLFIIVIIIMIYNNYNTFSNTNQKIVSELFENNNIISKLNEVKEYNTKPDDNSMLVDVPPDFYSHAKEDLMVPEINKDNNFPLSKELEVVDPVVIHPIVLPNQAFKDNLFVRDEGVNRAMDMLSKNTSTAYVDAANSHSTFMVPKDSKDLITYTQYEDIPKEKRDNMFLADIHDMMVGKIDENINKEELDRIMGKPIIYEDVKDMYKPVFVSVDPDQTSEMFKNIQYKFSGYNDLPFGSML
jgi:hypothetical protein